MRGDNFSIGFDRDRERYRNELNKNKTFKENYHVRIMHREFSIQLNVEKKLHAL